MLTCCVWVVTALCIFQDTSSLILSLRMELNESKGLDSVRDSYLEDRLYTQVIKQWQVEILGHGAKINFSPLNLGKLNRTACWSPERSATAATPQYPKIPYHTLCHGSGTYGSFEDCPGSSEISKTKVPDPCNVSSANMPGMIGFERNNQGRKLLILVSAAISDAAISRNFLRNNVKGENVDHCSVLFVGENCHQGLF